MNRSICISASEVYAVYILPPIIAKLRKIEQKIQVEIIASNASCDLRRREADIVLRNFQPTQPDLIANKIKEVSAQFYASSQYLQNIGKAKSTNDLEHADSIGFADTGALINSLKEIGLNLSKKNFPLLTENYITHWELVMQNTRHWNYARGSW